MTERVRLKRLLLHQPQFLRQHGFYASNAARYPATYRRIRRKFHISNRPETDHYRMTMYSLKVVSHGATSSNEEC